MKKAGRPRKNGLQPIWVLQRETLALFAYERAREAGEKHCVAVSEAVKYIRQTAPRMRISETEVKRIVAYWRPRGSTRCLRVTDSPHWLNGRSTSLTYRRSVIGAVPIGI
jgi:hypothetical protein